MPRLRRVVTYYTPGAPLGLYGMEFQTGFYFCAIRVSHNRGDDGSSRLSATGNLLNSHLHFLTPLPKIETPTAGSILPRLPRQLNAIKYGGADPARSITEQTDAFAIGLSGVMQILKFVVSQFDFDDFLNAAST